MRMRTSPGPGRGSGISPTTNTSRAGPCFSYQAALIEKPSSFQNFSARTISGLSRAGDIHNCLDGAGRQILHSRTRIRFLVRRGHFNQRLPAERESLRCVAYRATQP